MLVYRNILVLNIRREIKKSRTNSIILYYIMLGTRSLKFDTIQVAFTSNISINYIFFLNGFSILSIGNIINT